MRSLQAIKFPTPDNKLSLRLSAMSVSQDQIRFASDANSDQEIARVVRRRRRMYWLRFLTSEALAIAVLVLSIMAGISERFVSESLTAVFRTLPIAAAVVAAILPILFFGDPKRGGN